MKSLLSAVLLFSSSLALADIPVESHVAWSKRSVRVCFGNNEHRNATLAINDNSDFIEYTKDQKKWIKEIITQEYKLSEVGIEFIGWEDCDKTASKTDVVILRTEPQVPEGEGMFLEKGGRATIGERGNAMSSISASNVTVHSYEKGDPQYLNFVILNTRTAKEKRIGIENYIKITALHEFGHTGGLRHQHVNLKQALADENCKRTKDLKLSQEDIFSTTVFTGPYDNNSIMNYCYFNLLVDNGLSFKEKSLDKTPMVLSDSTLFTTTASDSGWPSRKPRVQVNVRLGFSALDKHALKCLYVFDEATKKDRCNYPQ
jgi:hypothetical protein